jgi:hypothetical protein
MNATPKLRGFSLRSLMLWLLLLSLSFGILWWSARFESIWLLNLGIGCLALAAILAWIGLQHTWKYTTYVVLLLFALYVGTYVTLSLQGRYEPNVAGLDGVKWYSWAPAGLVYEQPAGSRRLAKWNMPLVWAFWPLHRLDTSYWHPHERPGYKGRYPINDIH